MATGLKAAAPPVDDLARQRHMYEFLVRQAGGVAARLPQHLATVALVVLDATVRG